MTNYSFIDRKSPVNLVPGDCFIHKDMFWRVIENYNVRGYPPATRRMLMIVPANSAEPIAFDFLEIKTEVKMDTYIREE